MEKKFVLDQITDIDTDIFLTSFEYAAHLLITKKAELESQGWSSIHLKLEEWNDGAKLVVMGIRLETDNEFKKRIKKEQELAKKEKEKELKKEERNKKTYLRLKAKFEK